MDGEHPEWLPADWKVCVRVRNTGKKDKYYINPLNDLKFNSKPEVLRYLKTVANDKKQNKTNSKKTVPEKLPSGWIKEIRITKKGGKTRRHPYYIDPVDGHHFRSMQEVSRYLETKDSGKAESNRDGPHHTNAKGQRLNIKKEDKLLNENEGTKSDSAEVEQREKEKDSVAKDQQVVRQNKRKKSNSKWVNGLPRRASKRLAQVEADPPLEMKTRNGGREATRPSNEAEVNTIKDNSKPEINTSEDYGEQKEPTNVPLSDLSSVEEHEATGVDFKEDERREKHPDSSLNDILMDPCIEFAIKTLTGAIPIEDINKVHNSSVASLASAYQNPGSSSALPLGDIWADPSFEFAVKTLTSEIPMEDGSHFQISFKQPLSSSGASACNGITK